MLAPACSASATFSSSVPWAPARPPWASTSRGLLGRSLLRQRHARSSGAPGVDIPFIFEKEGEPGFRRARAGSHRRADAARAPGAGHRRRRRAAAGKPQDASRSAAAWCTWKRRSLSRSTGSAASQQPAAAAAMWTPCESSSSCMRAGRPSTPRSRIFTCRHRRAPGAERRGGKSHVYSRAARGHSDR